MPECEGLLNDVWCTAIELIAEGERLGSGGEIPRVEGTVREWRFGNWNVMVNVTRASAAVQPSGWSDRGSMRLRIAVLPAGFLAVWLRGILMGMWGPFDRVGRNGKARAVIAGLADEIGAVQGVAARGGCDG